MTENKPRTPQQAATTNQQLAGRLHLDHGLSSLVAQDNPDDSQLGAPDPKGRQRPNTPE